MKELKMEKKREVSQTHDKAKSSSEKLAKYDTPMQNYLSPEFKSPERFGQLVTNLSHSTNIIQRAQILTEMQQTYGNRYVQRAVSASRSQNIEKKQSEPMSAQDSISRMKFPLFKEMKETESLPNYIRLAQSYRCPEGAEISPPDDRLYHLNLKDADRLYEELYQGSGSTWCDTSSGTPQTSVTEHCSGDCVQQHEDVHVGDISACCAKYATCVSSGGANCASRWSTWVNSIRDWTECNAYTREVSCLTSLIQNGCGEGKPISAACCTTLRSELATATTRRGNHCPGTSHPCPF